MATNKQELEGNRFSDAAMVLIKGKTIKEFSLDTKTHFERTQKSLFANNTEKRITVIRWRMNM